MKLRRNLMLLSIISASPCAFAGVDALMEGCNGCHGDNGVSQWSDVPTIAGLAEFYHADNLYIYQEGGRPCAESEYRQGDTSQPAVTMCEIAADLSEDEIEEIAAAYAKLPYVKAKQSFDADLAAAGKDVHDAQCARCHADAGTDPDDEAGFLGGQMKGYLRTTFAEYASGEREQPSKMKEKMDLLSEADVDALINYYASIQ